MIQPTYVTFEQAKILKELGFDEVCSNAYNLNGLQYINGWCEYIDDDGLTIRNSVIKSKDVSAPEQWQVVEWLRVTHGIWVGVSVLQVFEDKQPLTVWHYHLRHKKDGWKIEYPSKDRLTSPQEAYSVAFDYIFNLI